MQFSPGQSHALLQEVDSTGVLDWRRQVVRVTATGVASEQLTERRRPMAAIAAARQIIKEILLQTLSGLPVISNVTVGDLSKRSDEVSVRLAAITERFIVTEVKPTATGRVELTAELPFAVIMAALLQSTYSQWESGKNVVHNRGTTTGISGLIIDTRGTAFKPALLPKARDEDGRELYGLKQAEPRWAIETGLVGYAESLESAIADPRIGHEPLLLRTVGAAGSEAVISRADARRLENGVTQSKILPECRVVFIIGEK